MIHTLGVDQKLEMSADVLVIGAGTVGLIAATRLAQAGMTVVCLESGGQVQDDEEHPLNAVVHRRRRYNGAAHGRFRCLGGTSTRWGGALIPFQPCDLASAGWPIPYAEIERHIPEAERLFHLGAGPYSFPDLGNFPKGSFLPRMAKWPPFAKRNVANLTAQSVRGNPGLDIWLNATVTDFSVEEGRLNRIAARSTDGGSIAVTAGEVLFCAGAIETTRLLLLLDQQNDGQIFAQDDVLGRYFSDHLSVMVAEVKPKKRNDLNMLTGFRFERSGTMRNLRFELAHDTALRQKAPPCFAHIAFKTEESGGFSALRDVMRHLQNRKAPSVGLLFQLARAGPWLARAVWWRYVHQRLLYPGDACIQLHMVVEQTPSPANRITLSDEWRDDLGQPQAEIDWDIEAEDVTALDKVTTAFAQAWAASDLEKLATLQCLDSKTLAQDLRNSGGIFHPVGPTRMGKTSQDGVVDADLRPFRLANVTVLATSVLPASGGANPTMMLILLALRAI